MLLRRMAELSIASPAGPRVMPSTSPAFAGTPALIAIRRPM